MSHGTMEWGSVLVMGQVFLLGVGCTALLCGLLGSAFPGV